MYQTRILNEQEIADFNKKFNTDYKVIHIRQRGKKYFAYLDCSIEILLRQKEALNYFI